ncbi:MAG: hypothetical protein KA746_05585 [Pyrinomonadaceae bacterium]|nr:hypothetical protein [Pyrinomonadaceae bacterium]MBP6212744.1 hypothetical protein [Pyrinomonadaceae bacterium]
MRTNVILTLCIAATAALFSACGAPAANTSNANAKPANSNANANATNTNTAANTAAAPATDGTVIKIDEAGLMMVVPKGFKFSKDGEDTVVKTEDEGVDIRFTVPKDGDYDKIIADAAKEIDEYLDDVKVENKGSKSDVNGMEASTLSGTAKNEGEDVVWNLTVVKAPKKPVLVNIYAAKSSLEKHQADIKKFLDSVKKQ